VHAGVFGLSRGDSGDGAVRFGAGQRCGATAAAGAHGGRRMAGGAGGGGGGEWGEGRTE
jgi:hypothetical protein